MVVHPQASAFDDVATEYERGRPGYPRALLDWVASHHPFSSSSTIVDLGAGTGKLTRLLLETGARVIAVEPLGAMRSVFRSILPDTELVGATAEELPLNTGSCDALFCGMSIHWFATTHALDEIARVLRPGGELLIATNSYDNLSPLQRRLIEIHREAEAAADEVTPGKDWASVVQGHAGFQLIGEMTLRNEHFVDREGLIGRVRSSSPFARLPGERQLELLEGLEGLIESDPVDLTGVTKVMALRCATLAGVVLAGSAMDDEAISELLEGRAGLLDVAADAARRYLAELAERHVGPPPEALEALARFVTPLPASGRDPAGILRELDEFASPATVATAGPRFFGFVNGGALPIAVATSWLLAAWDQNVALSVMSPAATRIEEVALSWVVELLGLPPGTAGGFVGGASMANATCLAAARDAVLRRAGHDALALGLVGAPPVQVLAGAEAHSSVIKALGLVGLGHDRVLRLPTDREGRIVARDLPRLEAPSILCLQAGNVNSGASDPFEELVAWAHAAGAWVHVDGAFGLWAAAAPHLAHLVAGVARADSWATDAHKWLNTTYDCGIALVADAESLTASMGSSAAYLPATGGRDPMAFTPQASQRARGVEVWAVLSSLGRDGLGELVAHSCALARRFASAIAGAGHEVMNEVVLNQVVVDFGSAQRNAEVIAAVQREGTCWCGPTRWRGRDAMRISVSCWATTEADIDRSAAALLGLAAQSVPARR